jgi:hypothetical protein
MKKNGRFSAIQSEIMGLLTKGWQGYQMYTEIFIKGQPACKLVTMKALQKQGFVYSYKTQGDITVWSVTPEGKSSWISYIKEADSQE